MAKPKKRAPGAGRKPQGDFEQLTSTFSMRMPQELREQLEAAAKKNRRSTAQELLRRLYDSFSINRDKTRDPAARALGFLLHEVINDISYNAPDGWHRSPFMFEAVKLAFAKVLKEVQPEGPEESEMNQFLNRMRHDPKNKSTPFLRFLGQQAKWWKSPRGVADETAKLVIQEMFAGAVHTPNEVPASYAAHAAEFPRPREQDEDFEKELVELERELEKKEVAAAERTLYGMIDVRRDLEFIKVEPTDEHKPKSRK